MIMEFAVEYTSVVESSEGIRMNSSSQQLLVDTYVFYVISKLSFKIIP